MIGVNVDLVKLEGSLRALNRRSRDLRGYYAVLRKPLRDDQRQHRKDKAGPDGAWVARSPFTIAKAQMSKRNGQRRRLRRPLGRLPAAIKIAVSSSGIVAESLVKWSMAHHTGARVGKGSRLPQRQWLWLSDGLLKLAGQEAAEYLASVWGKRA